MNAVSTLTTVLGMAGRNIAHIQLPVPQTNTTGGALVKHRRSIEDSLLSAGFDVTTTLALLFEKPVDATGADRRGGCQTCLVLCSDIRSTPWTVPSAIGPMKLIKVNEMIGYDPDSRPGATARAEQKGLNPHIEIIDAYIQGLTLQDQDHIVLFDILPNRYVEFGRAVCAQKIAGKWSAVSYMGLIKDGQKDVMQMMEEQVYNSWDAGPHAPSKMRVRDETQAPKLTAILWQNDRPVFPDSLVNKFPVGTEQHTEVLKMKNALEALWPSPSSNTPARNVNVPPRAVGEPDFADTTLLDLTREVDLAKIKSEDFAEEKLAVCQGKSNKPTIVITKDFRIYLANFTTEEVVHEQGELFAFNTGAFEVKIIKGSGHDELHCLPWRLGSDTTLISYEKTLMPLCSFICKMTRERGIADVTLFDHVLICPSL
ncbi:unnamed protein product [Durusdinium trenchii]|uniref:Uncharacterized protein n=1 Tax=Durusdinium trenchii TaxID=1381693 RepID=A0ABP0I3A0_9DINO